MEETDQELSRFVINFISIKLKDLSTVVQTLDSAGLSRVASCRWKLPLTWLVMASYSAWHFFTDGISFQGMGWGFDIFQKFAVKFLAHGHIIPVKCNQISPLRAAHCAVKYPKAGPKKGTIKISPNKTLQSFINVAASPKIHVPVTAAIIHFNHNPCYTA